jgi:hypothetical protein
MAYDGRGSVQTQLLQQQTGLTPDRQEMKQKILYMVLDGGYRLVQIT